MNTPLEVMRAIVDNGGPVEAWVRDLDETSWTKTEVNGVGVTRVGVPWYYGIGNPDTSEAIIRHWNKCSLTDPNANYVPIPTEWTHGWSSWRAVDKAGVLFEYSKSKPIRTDDGWINGGSVRPISKGHDPENWQDSLEERPRKTRPMTPREAALFLHGQPYAVQRKIWETWVPASAAVQLTDPQKWEYADLRDPDFPQWQDFPTVNA